MKFGTVSKAEGRNRSTRGHCKDLRTAGEKRRTRWFRCGPRSDFLKTARHCWDPDCFIVSPGKTFKAVSSRTGEEKNN